MCATNPSGLGLFLHDDDVTMESFLVPPYEGTTNSPSGADNATTRMLVNVTEGSSKGVTCDLYWQLYVRLACVPLLAGVGLLGNTLSFLVMFTPAFRRKSYSYYIRALAIFDNLTLVVTAILLADDVSVTYKGRGILTGHNAATCKLSEFLRNVIHLMSSWLIVCFTVDRYIAVCHPLKRVRLCTERSALVAIFCVLVGAMTSQLYIFYFIVHLQRDPGEYPCHAPRDLRIEYFGWNYFWYSFLLRFMLPFVIIVILNGRIVYQIMRMRASRFHREHERRRHSPSGVTGKTRSWSSNLAVYMLFVVCCTFVLTLLPTAVISMIWFMSLVVYRRLDLTLLCALRALEAPFLVIRLVNYSINFILYGFTGRQFRRELRRLPRTLTQCICHRHHLMVPQNYMLRGPLQRQSSSSSTRPVGRQPPPPYSSHQHVPSGSNNSNSSRQPSQTVPILPLTRANLVMHTRTTGLTSSSSPPPVNPRTSSGSYQYYRQRATTIS